MYVTKTGMGVGSSPDPLVVTGGCQSGYVSLVSLQRCFGRLNPGFRLLLKATNKVTDSLLMSSATWWDVFRCVGLCIITS